MTLRLTLICAVAALILGAVNIVTEPMILERKRIEKEIALKALSDGNTVGEEQTPANSDDLHKRLMASLADHGVIAAGGEIDEKAVITSYYPIGQDGKADRYILQLVGNGYGGKMVILAVFQADGTFVKAKLMENNETPGLGKKAESDDYYGRFEGSGSASAPVPVSKRALPAEYIEATSGCTITFNGIAKALALGSDYVKLLGGNN